MLRKSNVVETWFSKEEESVSHNNNNNGLINRILKLENELNKANNDMRPILLMSRVREKKVKTIDNFETFFPRDNELNKFSKKGRVIMLP